MANSSSSNTLPPYSFSYSTGVPSLGLSYAPPSDNEYTARSPRAYMTVNTASEDPVKNIALNLLAVKEKTTAIKNQMKALKMQLRNLESDESSLLIQLNMAVNGQYQTVIAPAPSLESSIIIAYQPPILSEQPVLSYNEYENSLEQSYCQIIEEINPSEDVHEDFGTHDRLLQSISTFKFLPKSGNIEDKIRLNRWKLRFDNLHDIQVNRFADNVDALYNKLLAAKVNGNGVLKSLENSVMDIGASTLRVVESNPETLDAQIKLWEDLIIYMEPRIKQLSRNQGSSNRLTQDRINAETSAAIEKALENKAKCLKQLQDKISFRVIQRYKNEKMINIYDDIILTKARKCAAENIIRNYTNIASLSDFFDYLVELRKKIEAIEDIYAFKVRVEKNDSVKSELEQACYNAAMVIASFEALEHRPLYERNKDLVIEEQTP